MEAYLLRANVSKREKPFILMRGAAELLDIRYPHYEQKRSRSIQETLWLLATDGIRSGFSNGLDPRATPQGIVDTIIAHFAKDTDDAMAIADHDGKQ